MHRRRINTEEKAKVVASVWGTELNQFLAALHTVDIFHQADFEEKGEWNTWQNSRFENMNDHLVYTIPTSTSPKQQR